MSLEELWSCAVFELVNIGQGKAFAAVTEKAARQVLSRDEWIRLNTQIEYATALATAEFYEFTWRPWAESRGLRTDPNLWFVNVPDTYEAWIRPYESASRYPWDSWGRFYDTMILPYYRTQGYLTEDAAVLERTGGRR